MRKPETNAPSLISAVLLVGSVLAAAYLDYITGPAASPLLFYLAAVVVTSTHSGRRVGVVSAIASVTLWHFINHLHGSPFALLWNDLSRIAILAVAAAIAHWASDVWIERSARNP